jgi:hypothetical protein
VGEHLLCKQGVVGSIPSASTSAASCVGESGGRSDRKGKGSKASWTMPWGFGLRPGACAV